MYAPIGPFVSFQASNVHVISSDLSWYYDLRLKSPWGQDQPNRPRPQHKSCDQEMTAQFFAWIRTTSSITPGKHLYSYSYSHLDHCLHAFVLILPGYGQPVRSVSPKPGRLPSPCGPQTPPVRTHQLPRPPESRSAGLTSCHSSVGMLSLSCGLCT